MSRALDVEALLAMYETYRGILKEKAEAEKELARATLMSKNTDDLSAQIDQLDNKLQDISDAMTFDTPRIWIEYKYKAYKSESQPIATMHDLRLHCSKPGYICTSRMDFLNDSLLQIEQTPLSDRDAYPDSMDIQTFLETHLLDTLPENIMTTWRRHEYNRDSSGSVAKWQSYTDA